MKEGANGRLLVQRNARNRYAGLLSAIVALSGASEDVHSQERAELQKVLPDARGISKHLMKTLLFHAILVSIDCDEVVVRNRLRNTGSSSCICCCNIRSCPELINTGLSMGNVYRSSDLIYLIYRIVHLSKLIYRIVHCHGSFIRL